MIILLLIERKSSTTLNALVGWSLKKAATEGFKNNRRVGIMTEVFSWMTELG